MRLKKKPKTAAEYIAMMPQPHRRTLQAMRKSIHAAAPGLNDSLYYSMPAVKLRKALVCYAAFTNHCSFFVMSRRVMADHADELKGYDVIPAGIRVPPDKPLPAKLIRSLVKARIIEIETAPKRSR